MNRRVASTLERKVTMSRLAAVSPASVFTPVNALVQHAEHLQNFSLADLLCGDNGRTRGEALRFTFGSLHVDFSKQRLTEQTPSLLAQWARGCRLEEKRRALFAGECVNHTEGRAALHMAARWPEGEPAPEGMAAAVAFSQAQHRKLAGLVEKLQAGHWQGATGKPMTEVVHIGVGGSDLGPKLVSEVLGDTPSRRHVRVHYVSIMDGSQLLPLMEALDPEATLLLLASKSFTTADTQFNVRTALAWLSGAMGVDVPSVCRHQLVGVSAKPEKMTEFGIPDAHQLAFLESVGGRFSVWSTIGISVAMELGMPAFERLLAGAHAMDRHFLAAPLAENLPVLLGTVGAWNTQFLEIPSHAVLPYDGRLKSFTAYLQQLEMESTGKSVGVDGQSVRHATCPILWGDVGPNAQHAFYQLLHQGSHTVSADFIAVAQRDVAASGHANAALRDQEALTLANCLAQSQLFALGDAAIPACLRGQMPPGYRGNQPNSVILLETLDAWSLGALMAMYEHKVFVQAALWGLNPFDQPGVELGKKLATRLYHRLAESPGAQASSPFHDEPVGDPGTELLLEQVDRWRYPSSP